MEHFPTLFSTFDIGKLRLRNRTVMAAMGTNFAHEDGTVSDRAIAYYAERARGGAGLIVTESSPASPRAKHRARCICVHDDSFLPGLKRLTGAVHGHGSAIALQLIHAGRHADPNLTGNPIEAPSPIPRWPGAPIPKELTEEEVDEIIGHFGSQAQRAKAAGFDAVEILGSHGYLIHLFFSPRTNQRKDIYGGSSENRGRFALEVMREVRRKVGGDFPIIFRLSLEEYAEGGYTREEALDWAVELERAGASVIHVSGGTNETVLSTVHVVSPMSFPTGYHVPLAEAAKKVLSIPVIAVDRISTPELAERILSEGKADLVAAGRPFLSDPYWPAKATRGEADRIRQCVACNQCVWTLYQQKPIICSQNAMLGREAEYQVRPVDRAKKIVVVGGGPGGLEAARVARTRGHEVTLMEKSSVLGGQMVLASIPPKKQTLMEAVEWLRREVEIEGVKVKLNTKGTVESIENEEPDAVILATGACPLSPSGFSGPNTQTAWDVLAGAKTGNRVLILGGGLVGVETAEFLSEKGCQVTVVEMLEELASDMEGTTRALFLDQLPGSGILTMVSTKVEEVRDGRVRVTRDGNTDWLEADTIVLALGSQSNQSLLRELKGKVSELLSVGDCVEPRKANEAIHEGFLAGLRVGSSEES